MGIIAANTGSVLTFGELMLRLCPDAGGNWLQDGTLPVNVGGAELNVATALACWGIPVKYFTALPDNGLSAQIITHLKGLKIDTSIINQSGHRVGVYYLTTGKDMKHDAVIYDRAESSFASLTTGVINWDVVLDGITWFHLSAICPALTEQTAKLCVEVLQAASDRGITISIDLNYRAKLWQYGIDPQEIMPELLQYCDLVMGNVWAAEKMLGIPVMGDIHESGQKSIYLKEALKTSEAIMQQYPKCKAVANTFRFDEGKGIRYYTALYTDDHLYHSAEYTSDYVVDKVGSGDCFMAGLIYGYYKQWAPSDTLNYATAAAYDKLYIAGDATNSSAEKITNAIKYDN